MHSFYAIKFEEEILQLDQTKSSAKEYVKSIEITQDLW
jgi:hypothetical protein